MSEEEWSKYDCDYCKVAGKCGYEKKVRESYNGNCPMRLMMGEPKVKTVMESRQS